jgi:hypothetical protein
MTALSLRTNSRLRFSPRRRPARRPIDEGEGEIRVTEEGDTRVTEAGEPRALETG